jgi:hypothetical protein
MNNAQRTSPNSHIVQHAGGTSLVGPDATNLYRAITCKQGLKMHVQTGGRMRLTRGASPTLLLQIAGEYTGKKYKRTEHAQAATDLELWIETMKAALPIIDERKPS